jgi:hypothetical protein
MIPIFLSVGACIMFGVVMIIVLKKRPFSIKGTHDLYLNDELVDDTGIAIDRKGTILHVPRLELGPEIRKITIKASGPIEVDFPFSYSRLTPTLDLEGLNRFQDLPLGQHHFKFKNSHFFIFQGVK